MGRLSHSCRPLTVESSSAGRRARSIKQDRTIGPGPIHPATYRPRHKPDSSSGWSSMRLVPPPVATWWKDVWRTAERSASRIRKQSVRGQEGAVSEREVQLDARLIDRARVVPSSVVIMPIREVEGVAVYPAATVTLVKELRALGVEAEYLDPPERRTFEVKKSGLEMAVGTVVLGILSNSAWDVIKALLRGTEMKALSVTYADLTRPNEAVRAWKIEGDTEAVLDAIERLRDEPGSGG
jgi:hypothetical protein